MNLTNYMINTCILIEPCLLFYSKLLSSLQLNSSSSSHLARCWTNCLPHNQPQYKPNPTNTQPQQEERDGVSKMLIIVGG